MNEEVVPENDLPDNLNSQAVSGQEVPHDDLPTDHEVPESDLPNDVKYQTTGQKIGTALEGAAQGVAGPLATYTEKKLSDFGVPGISPEEMKGRREANPELFAGSEAAGLVGSMLTGVGEAGLIAKGLTGLNAAKEAGFLAKVGSHAIKGAIQMGLIEGGDEISKAMLGQGDPAKPVSSALAHMGAASLLGAATGGIFSGVGQGASKALSAIEDSKLGTKLTNFLSGYGNRASFSGTPAQPTEEMLAKQLASVPSDIGAGAQSQDSFYRLGQKTFDESVPKLAQRVTEAAGAKLYGPSGVYLADKLGIGKAIDQILRKTITRTSNNYLGPMILKVASSGSVEKLGQVLDYARSIETGNQMVSKGIEAVFKAGSQDVLNYSQNEKNRDKLKEFIENGGIDQQIREDNQMQAAPQYAEGGKVSPINEQPNEIAKHWPEQNVLLNTARGRISGYLNSVRPTDNINKLPYDTKQKDHSKEKEYNKTLDLANQPLSVLKHIKEGTLLPKHVHAINQMYPELYTHLSQKLQERMAKGQLKDEKKPPYKTRQALSLFLGASLDSTLTPQGIMAAQNVFAQQKAQKAAPQGNTYALKKMGDSMQTAEQSRTQDLSKH